MALLVRPPLSTDLYCCCPLFYARIFLADMYNAVPSSVASISFYIMVICVRNITLESLVCNCNDVIMTKFDYVAIKPSVFSALFLIRRIKKLDRSECINV